MEAIIALENNERVSRGDIIAWGSTCTEERAKAMSQFQLEPDNEENDELLYGECQAVEGERPTMDICSDTQPNYDFKSIHIWNFDEQRMDLRTDTQSREIIRSEFKKQAKLRLGCTEKKFERMDNPRSLQNEKDNVDSANTENQIRNIINSAISGEPTDEQVRMNMKRKAEEKQKQKKAAQRQREIDAQNNRRIR